VLPPTFSTIYKNSNGGSEKSGYLHVTNNEEYIKLIESLKIDESEFNKLVTVNFKEYDIIILYQGQKNTGGYSIDVASIHWEKDILLVKKNETFPEAGKPVTMALTNPYCITIIPKAKNIFIEK
jgi:enhancing lycopene biosynthesis protein 2